VPKSSRISDNGNSGHIAEAGQSPSIGVRAHFADAPRLSIVVLPINNLTSDPEQEYFADAITDSLTTDLLRIAGSFVIARNTAFTYRGKSIGARQIGAELGVRYVLEGSVQRSGKQIRVNAQLIDAESEAHLWAERFDRDGSDLFALQDEITQRVAVTLNIELVGAEAARPTGHPEALDYILRGRAATMTPASRENRTAAIGLFERALALDPRSVAAQSYLATALSARVLDHLTDTAATDIERADGLAWAGIGRLASQRARALRQRPGIEGTESIRGGHCRIRNGNRVRSCAPMPL
jgi:TolB-like protein